jgi:glycerol-3-phosphate O-acyltransferase/dihydroxyacetone phosphate acyltransferase
MDYHRCQLNSHLLKSRILVPSASAPPSSGTPGLWRRISSTGAVDAQGLGLTHPMTWIDERLFGWSRSATRGTSAWGGNVDDVSRVNTPDDSDEEDTGDYDNVVGLVGDEHTPASYKSRSRQSSYADLQRLRMAPLASQTRSENEGLNPRARLSPRSRRASLTDGVAVTRIAAVDPEEPFSAATQDLNDEITHAKTS